MGGSIGNHLVVMNLILRPIEDINDPVWSVIISIIILLAGVFYVIVYILGIDERESHGSDDTSKSEELLQLPSDGDQQSSGRGCLLYTSPSPRDAHESRMPSSA